MLATDVDKNNKAREIFQQMKKKQFYLCTALMSGDAKLFFISSYFKFRNHHNWDIS